MSRATKIPYLDTLQQTPASAPPADAAPTSVLKARVGAPNPYTAPRLAEEAESAPRIRGAAYAVRELSEEQDRLIAREAVLVDAGETETHATCDLSLVRMRLRSLSGEIAFHQKELQSLRKAVGAI